MTYNEIVDDILEQLGLTSDTARTRIGKRVNKVYQIVTSGIGMATSRQLTVDYTVDPTTITVPPPDPDQTFLPDLTFGSFEKILRISLMYGARPKRLDQLTYDDVTKFPSPARIPRAWAQKRMGAHEVTVTFDSTPVEEFDIRVDGFELTDYLEDDVEPAFPESFHDILIQGVLKRELMKLEKPALAKIAEDDYTNLLSDLKLYIAKSGYLDQYQGKNAKTDYWATRGLTPRY